MKYLYYNELNLTNIFMWTLESDKFKRLTSDEIAAHNQNPRARDLPFNEVLPIGRMFDVMMKFTVADGAKELTVTTFVDTEETAGRTVADKLTKMNK
ncbi:MAG: hypothetical protein IKD58_09170 [Loktanella sp.]|nr:hypothetical protein [Loktanella sp.]